MKKGITTIELVVVVAIIGVMICIPMFAKAYTMKANIAVVEKAKEKLMLPEGTVRGAMGLENTSADLSSGSARDHLLMALNITDLSDLKVGGREIIVGSLQEKAHYQ